MLDAMIHTVALRGYERTTVSRMLTYAELPDAVFSEHFHDKHDCFMQALDELITSAERAAIEHFARRVPWQERMKGALRDLIDALACNEDATRVLFVEMLAAGPSALERQRQALELFTSLVEQGRALAPHAEQLAPQTSEAIVGGIASILHRRALQGEVAQLHALLPDLLYFALLPYLDPSEAMSAAELHAAA
jgi:AcrR family transcriptional regulator